MMEGQQRVKRILIVEDEPHIAQLIAYNLSAAGYLTVIAVNGSEAIASINAVAPDLVTLDLLLPLQSGWEVLHTIRQHPSRHIATLPIIVVSALSSPHLQTDLQRHGVSHCLGKPFSVTALCMLVHSMLEKPCDASWLSPA